MRLIKSVARQIYKVASGQTMTEYALILAAIAIAVILAYQNLGTDITNLVSSVGSSLTAS
jgi:Flp pilus assembly pilin Flp